MTGDRHRKYRMLLTTIYATGRVIRVVTVKEENGCQFFFCTDPEATPREIIEAFVRRSNRTFTM
jgi:hypothetical protein